jgi:aspartate racemase
MRRKIVGVLGGMGPVATTQYMARVQALTPAIRDQDHLHLLVDCNPHVPGFAPEADVQGPAPETVLADMARRLEAMGAELLVMPCNTAHAYVAAITAATSLPFLNLIEAVAEAACAEGASTVGILAADPCLAAGLYQEAFARRGVEVVLPKAAEQATLMDLIHAIKAGSLGAATRRSMVELAEDLIARGAEVIVAGCTEVPLVLSPTDVAVPLADSLEILAARTVATA